MNYRFNATRFRQSSFVLLVLMVSTLVVPELSFSQILPKKEVRLNSGDAIHLYVYDGLNPTEERRFISVFHDVEFIIDDFGEIQLFSLGKVRVAGLTANEIAFLLQEKFKPFAKEPIVIVEPLIRITLRGAFKNPGMYRFSLNLSFWDMVRRAGGLTDYNIKKMKLRRKDKDLSKDFSEALYKATSIYELGLQSGDEIFAPPSRKITFRTITAVAYTAIQFLYIYYAIEYRRGK